MVNIAFTGGGTGGHIYPGLAAAAELKHLLAEGREFRLFWIGSAAGMDRKLVENAGIEFFGIPSGKLRRYFSIKNAADFFRVIAGFFAARKILKKEKVRLLFSKGGFVSVPPCAAAASLGISVYTHESDFSPGLATKINTRFVSRTGGKIFTAYSETIPFLPPLVRSSAAVSGNPVRAVFRCADAAKGRAFLGTGAEERILLVLGGSQGAAEINNLVCAALPEMVKVYTVVHQTGAGFKYGAGMEQYLTGENSNSYKPYSYIAEEMPHVLAAAELVLGRSGAGTVWECAVLGKPMILVPLAGSGTRGDQIENARYFEKAGAAQVLLGENVNPQALVCAVNFLADNIEERTVMAAASKKIGETDGAAFIAGILSHEINLIYGEKNESFHD